MSVCIKKLHFRSRFGKCATTPSENDGRDPCPLACTHITTELRYEALVTGQIIMAAMMAVAPSSWIIRNNSAYEHDPHSPTFRVS